MKVLPTLYRKINPMAFVLRDGEGYDDFESCKEELMMIKNDDKEYILRDVFSNSKYISRLDVSCTEFKNLNGFEFNIAWLYLFHNLNLNTLDGLQKCKIQCMKFIGNNQLNSFHNIHKHLKDVGLRQVEIGKGTLPITNLLGFLMLQDFTEIYMEKDTIAPDGSEMLRFVEAVQIINQHSCSPETDVLECQEEMIKYGLKEYAKL